MSVCPVGALYENTSWREVLGLLQNKRKVRGKLGEGGGGILVCVCVEGGGMGGDGGGYIVLIRRPCEHELEGSAGTAAE